MSILCPPEHSPILQLLKQFQYGNLWDKERQCRRLLISRLALHNYFELHVQKFQCLHLVSERVFKSLMTLYGVDDF